MFLTAFSDELCKLAQEVPLPRYTPTPAQIAARKRRGPVDPRPKRPAYREPGAKAPLTHGAFAYRGYMKRPKPGSPAYHKKERELNPWMSDKKKWSKYHYPKRTVAGAPMPAGLGPKGKRITEDTAYADYQARLARREQKAYRKHTFKGKLETKAEKIPGYR